MTDLGTWRPTAHDARGSEGERCRCFECAPTPTLSVYDALRSPSKRAERDLQIAASLRLAPDEVEPFLRRLALYDLREEARQEEEAVTRLLAARRRRVEVEGRGDLGRLRGQGIRRLRGVAA